MKTREITIDDSGRSVLDEHAGSYGRNLRVGQTVHIQEGGDYHAEYVVRDIGTRIQTGPPGVSNRITVTLESAGEEAS